MVELNRRPPVLGEEVVLASQFFASVPELVREVAQPAAELDRSVLCVLNSLHHALGFAPHRTPHATSL